MIFYWLFTFIAQVVFTIVSKIFVLIDDISKYNFFSQGTINDFTSKVYVIIGVLMLFKLVISAVQYIVNPDMFDDKNKGLGAILKKSIIAVVLLAIVPSIFTFAMEVQGDIVDQIPKVIFGNQNYSMADASDNISMTVMSSFLQARNGKNPIRELNSVSDFFDVATEGCANNWLSLNFFTGVECFYEPTVMITPIVGVFFMYVLISLVIDVATRTIKLGIVQILAPIPITGYITDEKKMTNWAKTSVQIYVDLFIRLAVIYLIVYIIQVVLRDMFASTGYESLVNGMSGAINRTPDSLEIGLIKIVIIAALLLFAKNAPKFITELLGLKGAGEGFNDMFKRAGGLFGATVGGLRTARSNYTTQKERYAGKGYGRGRQIAAGLRSAAAGLASETGRGMLLTGQGKGFKDVRDTAFKKAIEARNRRNDRVDNLYDEEYGYFDYKRDVKREKLGIPSNEGFIKTRYDAMQNIAKLAADSKSHGVGKMNETPNRYSIAFDTSNYAGQIDFSSTTDANQNLIRATLGYSSLSSTDAMAIYDAARTGKSVRAANGANITLTNDQINALGKVLFKDADFKTIHDTLGFDSLTMEQVRNMYNMARNGQAVNDVHGNSIRLSNEQLNSLGTLVQNIEKRTSYLKEAELMGTGDPAASPNVDKIAMAIRSNKSMFTSDVIMNPIIEKMRKYGIRTSDGKPVTDVDKLLNVVDGLQKQLKRADFASDADYFAEVSKRADVLNFIKDSFEEIAKQQYKSAEISGSRAKKAQGAISNNDKK